MQRYFIQLSYNGANYFGWQIQPQQITVQEIMERSISTITREEINIVGAGRTDSGVHSSFYVAHFDSLRDDLDGDKFIFKVNRLLPPDVSVHNIFKVEPESHARFDATYRRYNYFITTEKNPFLTGFTYMMSRRLDIEAMNRAAAILFDYSDFESFSKVGSDNKTNICTIRYVKWVQRSGVLQFTIEADRFLRNMVRAIVGTLLEVGLGKLDEDGFREVIESKSRGRAGTSVPGHALFLADVGYPDSLSYGLDRSVSDIFPNI